MLDHKQDIQVLSPDIVTEPELAPILALHRHRDGYITFAVARDRGEDFRPLVSIRADELARYFPQFREQFLKDSYVSINAAWRLRRHGPDGAAYGHPLHRTDRLRYLCAAYCDIDYYRIGKTWGQAMGRVLELQDAGEMPKASIIVRSGRGLWLVFLIHDAKDPASAQRAFDEKKEQYYRLQRAIGERLEEIGSDSGARDAARYIRVPGSLHTGSEQYAQWWIQGDGPRAYSYDLDSLCRLFRVSPVIRHPRERAAITGPKDSVKQAAGRTGWAAMNARRLRDFNLLREMRGGFSQGCRHRAAMIYAWLLRCNRVPRPDGADLVNLFGGECHAPLAHSDCRDAVKTGYGKRMRQMRDKTIADWLDVQPHEAAALERLPPAVRFGPRIPGPMAPDLQTKSIVDRRAMITKIVAELGYIPPVRDMGRRLIEAGFRGNHQTVQIDYEALEIQSNRTRAARAAERAKQLTLSES